MHRADGMKWVVGLVLVAAFWGSFPGGAGRAFGQPPACSYRVDLYDSWGDGWINGSLSVHVDGTTALTSVTLTYGFGPAQYYFPVSHGAEITTTCNPGLHPTEPSYYIYDSEGNQVYASGLGGTVPESLGPGQLFAVCPAAILPSSGPSSGGNVVVVTNASPAIGSGSDITNVTVAGVTATIVGQGTDWVSFQPGPSPQPMQALVSTILIQSTSVGTTALEDAYTYNPAGIIGSRFACSPLGAGVEHQLALKSDGSIVAWGNNDAGQTNAPAGNAFVAVAAVGSHGLALQSTGSLAAWGYNDAGQTDVPSGTDYIAVAGGANSSLALKSDGSIVAWGENSSGQTNAPSGNEFIAIAGGYYHALALRTDGSIAAWGNNTYGQANAPAGNDFVAVAGGGYHSLALKSDGSIVAWGVNNNGQTNAPAGNDFVAIAAGWGHSLALKTDGSIVAWGWNTSGQANAPAGNDFAAVAGGYTRSLAMKSDGSIVAWGDNTSGHGQVPLPNSGFGCVPSGVSPAAGSWTGGYEVVISGENLCDGSDVTDVTLGGVSVASVVSQSGTQIVVVAGAASFSGLGDVRVFSTSFGETVKSNAFEYVRETQAALVFSPASPQVYGTTNGLSTTGGSGTGAVSYAVSSGPGQIVGGTNLLAHSGTGSIVVEATKAADATYYSQSATATVVLARAQQTLVFGQTPLVVVESNEVLVATSPASGSVFFASMDDSICTITGSTAYGVAVGVCAITADHAGDANYAAAPQIVRNLAVIPSGLASVGPVWWYTRQAVEVNNPANDYAAVNAGQLKWIAQQAYDEMEEVLSGGAGSNVTEIVSLMVNSNNFVSVNVGQVKALAEPFYDRLALPYPWTATTDDDNNHAAANIGQVKHVFQFEIVDD